MKSKKLEDMSEKQKSKLVRMMKSGFLLEKNQYDGEWVRAKSIDSSKYYKTDSSNPHWKWRRFKNLDIYSFIKHKGEQLIAVPTDKHFNCGSSHTDYVCKECHFDDKSECPINHEGDFHCINVRGHDVFFVKFTDMSDSDRDYILAHGAIKQ